MATIASSLRRGGFPVLLPFAAALLYLRVLVGILLEYRWYFPADFENAAFLGGREGHFFSGYAAAFYAHILVGPLVSLLALVLLTTGGQARYVRLHRLAGRSLTLLVLAVLLPSGWLMAHRSFGGPLAATGFRGLAIATAVYTLLTVVFAWRRQFRRHLRWALGAFVLLASPIILRLAAGLATVTGVESELTYQLNAWLSWLVPLLAFEGWWWLRSLPSAAQLRSLHNNPHLSTTRAEEEKKVRCFTWI